MKKVAYAILCYSLLVSFMIALPPVRGAQVTYTLNVSYLTWDPKTITANQMDTVRLTIANVDPNSDNNHGFELKDPDGIVVFDLLDVYRNGLSPGQSYTVPDFIASKAGTYTFRCNLGCYGHGNLQDGKLIVSAPQPGWIEGTVVDAVTLAPLLGATVVADSTSTTTDNTGYYKISNLAAGTYTVTASMLGYQSASATVTVASGAGTTQNFVLSPAPIFRIDLVRRSAWAKVEGFSVTFYAIAKNVGTVATYGKVKFTITGGTAETAPQWLEPEQIYGHESDARYTITWIALGSGIYEVSAESWYDADGNLATVDWTDSPDGPKNFTIRISA